MSDATYARFRAAMERWRLSLWRADNYHLQAQATREYRKAVMAGDITSEPCVVCGSFDRVHGHHEDYAKPLEIVWLCPIHHSWRHRYHETVEHMRSYRDAGA